MSLLVDIFRCVAVINGVVVAVLDLVFFLLLLPFLNRLFCRCSRLLI